MSARTLSELMDFEHVIRVLPDGTAVDAPDDVRAPEVYAYDGEIDTSQLEAAGWELMAGYSGQYGYAGPWMHQSEYIGGGLERDILATPGLYVAIYPAGLEDPDTWAIARKVDA